MIANRRFIGAWVLVSFETTRPDGTVTRPLGDDPAGIICWDASGWFSAQLGPRDAPPGRYVAYYGVIEAPDSPRGTLVHHVQGTFDAARVGGRQVRDFVFLDDDTLTLSPPPAADGARSVVLWRRQHGES